MFVELKIKEIEGMEFRMKKLLLSALLLMASAHAMGPNNQVKAESDLIAAIRNRDLKGAQVAVQNGAPVGEIKVLLGYKGERPLVQAYYHGAYDIADYLISKGAKVNELNSFLASEAVKPDSAQVEWLLKHGVKDVNDAALRQAKAMQKHEALGSKAEFGQVIKLLEQARPQRGIFKELETEEFLKPAGK